MLQNTEILSRKCNCLPVCQLSQHHFVLCEIEFQFVNIVHKTTENSSMCHPLQCVLELFLGFTL